MEITNTSRTTPQVLATERDCGTCKKCCEGWLYGEAYGLPFFPNHPCHYLDTDPNKCGGCTIYEKRPAICIDFQCLWKQDQQVPLWMKPDKSGVILYHRSYEDVEGDYKEPGWTIHWISMVECGQQVDSTVLNWVIQQARFNEFNLHYTVKRQDYYLGSPEFHEFSKNGNLATKTKVIVESNEE
jgi:hypothetical protein